MTETGKIYTIADENKPIEYCTVSQFVNKDVYHFSLAKDTDISAEIYPYSKLFIMASGSITINGEIELKKDDCYITKENSLVGVKAKEEAVYTEICLRKEHKMKEILKDGKVFRLKDLLPYQEGKIVNMDLINEKNMKFVLMSFDTDTGLNEHAAPGEAIVFALDGEATIGYEGKEYAIKEGENFSFAKGGLHYVKADKRFKMALLLTLDR